MNTETLANKDSVQIQKHGPITWVDVSRPSPEVFAHLESEYHLHPVHLEESIQRIQHDRVEREAGYLFFVLHLPLQNQHNGRIHDGQVGIFLGKDTLITIHHGHLPVITDIFTACGHDDVQKEQYFHRGAAFLLYTIIAEILNDMFDMAETLQSELDSIEDLVFGNSTSDTYAIGVIRQKIVKLSRLTGPKRIILDDLAQQVDSFADRSITRYYSNNTKTVNKLWEVLEEAKETVEIYKDADFITSTERTNKTLAILTLVFTLTIPATVVGAFYGMNVPLPGGLASGAWNFWGQYTTLWFVLLLSIGSAVGMYAYFKIRRWL